MSETALLVYNVCDLYVYTPGYNVTCAGNWDELTLFFQVGTNTKGVMSCM